MRRALAVILGVLLACIPVVGIAQSATDRQMADSQAAAGLGSVFAWPANQNIADPTIVMRILQDAASDVQVNILRQSTFRDPSGRAHMSSYIMMGSNSTALFKEFTLRSGRWPSPEECRAGRIAVSTMTASQFNDVSIVGVPNVLGNRYDLTIASLPVAFDELPAAGTYIVETEDASSLDALLSDVVSAARRYDSSLSTDDFQMQWADGTHSSGHGSIMTLLIVMIAAIAVVVSLVLLTRRARAIGVMRLLGFSPSRIWMHTIGRILLVCLAISLFLGLGLLVIAGGADGTMFSRVFATTAVTLLMCMSATYGAGMVIINRVDVDDLVKGAI